MENFARILDRAWSTIVIFHPLLQPIKETLGVRPLLMLQKKLTTYHVQENPERAVPFLLFDLYH